MRNVGQMEPKVTICGSSGKFTSSFQFVWYVIQMKMLNSINCLVSETSDKLHGLLFSSGTLVYLLSIKISPSTSKKNSLPRIKQTECDMDSKIKLKVFKEMVNEFKTYGLETIRGKLFP